MDTKINNPTTTATTTTMITMAMAPRRRRTPQISFTCLLLLLLLSLGLNPGGPSGGVSQASVVNPHTTLQCHGRSYAIRVSKPPVLNQQGQLVTCEGDVRVRACWGRCDSSEVGDYRMPFKMSTHPVCTYTGRVSRRVKLTECDGYPDPTVEVFDATGCGCHLCNSEFTSCENLNG